MDDDDDGSKVTTIAHVASTLCQMSKTKYFIFLIKVLLNLAFIQNESFNTEKQAPSNDTKWQLATVLTFKHPWEIVSFNIKI